MLRFQTTLAAAALLCLLGCSDDPATSPDSDPVVPTEDSELLVHLESTDANGNHTQSFEFGDEIRFTYEVKNTTGHDQTWNMKHEGVSSASVWFWRDTHQAHHASTSRPESQTGILRAGQSLRFEFSTFAERPGTAVLDGTFRVRGHAGFEFDGRPALTVPELVVEVKPPPGMDQRVFSLGTRSGLGYCPPIGFFEGVLFRNDDGRYEMHGTRLLEDDSLWNRRKESYPPVQLTTEQASEFTRLIQEFPTVDPDIDGACDPCVLRFYDFADHKVILWGGCTRGPEEYLEHMNDIWEFASSLVGN